MKPVIVYTTKRCPYCDGAKRLLDSKGVAYKEFRVDERPELVDEVIQKSGGKKTVPQIFIDDDHVGGCDELYALEQNGKLDPMLGL